MGAAASNLSGCGAGGPELGEVEGTVTLDGQPLPYATVEFLPEGGRPSIGRTDPNGHYELRFTETRKGALVGTHVVTVTTERWDGDFMDADGKPLPAMGEKVHSRFNRNARENPDMRYEVKPGNNVIDLPVESRSAP
jgi:hypothetical protein